MYIFSLFWLESATLLPNYTYYFQKGERGSTLPACSRIQYNYYLLFFKKKIHIRLVIGIYTLSSRYSNSSAIIYFGTCKL